MPFLLVSGVLNSASGILGPILIASKDSRAMGISAIVGALTNIVLNILLVYYIGAQGAAIATVISSLAIYLMRRRAVGNDIRNYNKWALYISWAVIIFQAIMEVCALGYIFEIVLMGMVIFMYKKYIIFIYGKIKRMLRVKIFHGGKSNE